MKLSVCTHVVERAVSDVPLALRIVVKPPRGMINLCTSLEQVEIFPDVDFALPTLTTADAARAIG